MVWFGVFFFLLNHKFIDVCVLEGLVLLDTLNLLLFFTGFYSINHTDCLESLIHHCFDGTTGELAHAFFPPNGEIHFDDHEYWILGNTRFSWKKGDTCLGEHTLAAGGGCSLAFVPGFTSMGNRRQNWLGEDHAALVLKYSSSFTPEQLTHLTPNDSGFPFLSQAFGLQTWSTWQLTK